MKREDLENIPSKDLQIINQLWLAASEGKFGFSVQKQILTDLGDELKGDYIDVFDVFERFLNKVEWAEDEIIFDVFERFLNKVEWAEDQEIVFDQRLVKGHLPMAVYLKVSNNSFLNQKWWMEINKIAKISKEEKYGVKNMVCKELQKKEWELKKDITSRLEKIPKQGKPTTVVRRRNQRIRNIVGGGGILLIFVMGIVASIVRGDFNILLSSYFIGGLYSLVFVFVNIFILERQDSVEQGCEMIVRALIMKMMGYENYLFFLSRKDL